MKNLIRKIRWIYINFKFKIQRYRKRWYQIFIPNEKRKNDVIEYCDANNIKYSIPVQKFDGWHFLIKTDYSGISNVTVILKTPFK